MEKYKFELLVRSKTKLYQRITWTLQVNLIKQPTIQCVIATFPSMKIVLKCLYERIENTNAIIYIKYSYGSEVLFVDGVSLASLFN